MSDNTVFITYNNNRRKSKSTTTLGHFGHTLNANKTIFEI